MSYSTTRPHRKSYGSHWFWHFTAPTGDFLAEKVLDDYERRQARRRDIAYRFDRSIGSLWFMDTPPSSWELLARKFWEEDPWDGESL